MRRNHLPYLSDPLSGHSFQKIINFQEKSSHIISGILIAQNTWYPIINGVPRILVDELKENLLQTHQEFFNTWKNKIPKMFVVNGKNLSTLSQILMPFGSTKKELLKALLTNGNTSTKRTVMKRITFFIFSPPFSMNHNSKGKRLWTSGVVPEDLPNGQRSQEQKFPLDLISVKPLRLPTT